MLISSVARLKDGKVFYEILKHMLIRQGMPETEIDFDIKQLSPEERIKLVICSLIELIEVDEHRDVLDEFINGREYKRGDNAFLIDFGLLMKDIADKGYEISEDQRQFIHWKWKEMETEMSNEVIEEKEDCYNFKDQYKHKQEVERDTKTKLKEDKEIIKCKSKQENQLGLNLGLGQRRNSKNKDYKNNLHHGNSQTNKTNMDKHYSEIENEETELNHQQVSNLSFSITNNNDNNSNPISCLNYSHINEIVLKPRNKHCVCLNMLLGIRKIIETNQKEESIINNENNNHSIDNHSYSPPLFEYAHFFYPTKPIINTTIFTIRKYITANNNNDNTMIAFTNASVSNSLMKIMKSNDQKCSSLFSQNKNALLIKWLKTIKAINNNNSNSIISQFKAGTLLCNIISSCENKKESQAITKSMSLIKRKDIQSNITKALTHFKKLKIPSSESWSVKQIEKGEEEFALNVLNSLHHYYSSDKPNQTLGTILFNDSITNDNIQNAQPLNQISFISNIPKKTRNFDVNNIASVDNSNNCTIFQCLNNNNNISTIRLNHNDAILKRPKKIAVKSRNASVPKRIISPKKNSSVSKLPDCFIILQKSNIRQIKSHITKLTLMSSNTNLSKSKK